MTDDRTPNLNLPLPHQDNLLLQDVVRLRSALTAIDSELNGILSKFGAANGLAQLDATGKVPAAQLPSYVDDVLEFASLAAFPGSGEQGKIYVALDTGEQYRWSGSAYIVISPSPGSTDDVPEGSVNRYFTDARARSAQMPATASTLGVVKVGANISVAEDGTVSVPSLPFSALADKPTTLAGYGITDVPAGATGSGGDQVFFTNQQVVTTSYAIPSGRNAMTTGPITVSAGVVVTIPSGSRWVIL